MAKRVFQNASFTATNTADATNLANSTYLALRGGSGTQKLDVLEVLVSGTATASAVAAMQLARSGAIGSTTTLIIAPVSDGPEDFATVALAAPPISFVNAVGGPTRSAAVTDARLNLGINAFGGIIRWNAAPTQQWNIIGNTAPGGESNLSNNSTGGSSTTVMAHIIYEPY